MRSTDLTDNQLEIIADQLAPMLDYFRRMEERMDDQGFDESDRLRYLVAEARQALEKLGTELATLAAFDGLKLPPHGKLKRKRDLH
jgi:hypothetical protein